MILLAESGSTKTDWRILGKEYSNQSIETIGLNPYFLDENQIAEALKQTIVSKIHSKISKIYFYGTGITESSKGEIIKKGICKAFDYEILIETFSDIVAATHALFGKESGIACILGTGSNSCLWDGSKIIYQVAPLGFWLGDEGSGAHMGKMLVLSYLHHEMPERVRIFFEMQFGKFDRLEVLSKMKDRPNKYFAEFAIFISENKNEPFIQNIVNDSLELFFEKYLLKYPNYQNQKIGFVGSIAYYFQENLRAIAQKHHISQIEIIQKPIDKLVNFYLNHQD